MINLTLAVTSQIFMTAHAQEEFARISIDFGQNSDCPFTDSQLELLREISTGQVVPDSAKAKQGGRIPLTIRERNEWSYAQNRLEAIHPPSVIKSNEGMRWRVFVAVFDGTWNDKDDPSLPITVPGHLANELKTDDFVKVRYYEGVGSRKWMPDKTLGWHNRPRCR